MIFRTSLFKQQNQLRKIIGATRGGTRGPAMLLFKKKFLAAIRRGEKTQTIRLWKHRRMKTGQRSYIPGVGPVRIHVVEQVRLEDLTDRDARPDGFADAAQLRAELHQIYGSQIEAGYQAYRIVFEVLADE